MKTQDIETIDRMQRYGGLFCKALAIAARVADPDNLRKIKDTWPGFWERYGECGVFAQRERDNDDERYFLKQEKLKQDAREDD